MAKAKTYLEIYDENRIYDRDSGELMTMLTCSNNHDVWQALVRTTNRMVMILRCRVCGEEIRLVVVRYG
jgi:hypothetical protein